jgi:hypothetical protein
MLRCLAESIQMTTMETAVAELLVAIPEYVPEESRDLDLPDVVYGGFAHFLRDLYNGRPRQDELLRRCFDFLESLAVTDEWLASLVEAGVLEILGDEDRGQRVRSSMVGFLSLMGPKTAYLFRHVEALWTGTIEQFERLSPDEGLSEQWPPP